MAGSYIYKKFIKQLYKVGFLQSVAKSHAPRTQSVAKSHAQKIN